MAFYKRWLPPNYGQIVRCDFEKTQVAGPGVVELRQYLTDFQFMATKLTDLGQHVDSEWLLFALRSGLEANPYALEFVNREEELVIEDGVLVRHRMADTYEGVYAALLRYLETTARRRRPAARGGVARLAALAEEPEDEPESEAEQAEIELDSEDAFLELEEAAACCVAAAGDGGSEITGVLAALSAERLAQTECLNCHQMGHIGRDCPKAKAEGGFTKEYSAFLNAKATERAERSKRGPAVRAPAKWPPVPAGRNAGRRR